MKNLSVITLSVVLLFCSLCSSAQKREIPINEPDYNKPKLFADLPDRIAFNPASMQDIFKLKVGQTVTISLSTGFNFSGEVVSTSTDPKATSIVVRSTNRMGARLTLTRIVDSNNIIKYIGRIISLQHGDSYDIVNENNQYYLKKKGLYDIVND